MSGEVDTDRIIEDVALECEDWAVHDPSFRELDLQSLGKSESYVTANGTEWIGAMAVQHAYVGGSPVGYDTTVSLQCRRHMTKLPSGLETCGPRPEDDLIHEVETIFSADFKINPQGFFSWKTYRSYKITHCDPMAAENDDELVDDDPDARTAWYRNEVEMISEFPRESDVLAQILFDSEDIMHLWERQKMAELMRATTRLIFDEDRRCLLPYAVDLLPAEALEKNELHYPL